MDVFLIPLIHHWGGEIRTVRRRAGGLRGASISDFNGKDGAITSMRDSAPAWYVAEYVSLRLSTLMSVSRKISVRTCTWVVQTHFWRIKYTHGELRFATFSMFPRQHFKMRISSSMIFISNLLFQVTHFENVPPIDWGWRGGVVFVYWGMKNSYCVLFWAEVN